MLSVIIDGEADFADVCYAVAVILAVLSVVAGFTTSARLAALAHPALAAAIGCLALGLLVL